MDGGRKKPSNIYAEVPSSIYAVDLTKLSELVGCTESELIDGIHTDNAVDMQGVMVDSGLDVPFEAIGMRTEEEKESDMILKSPIRKHHPIKQVLVTAASRPSALDTFELPKCLIQLGGQTIIEHILSQLYAAGMERIVISVSNQGEKIMETVKKSRFYDKLNIEFLNLGEENNEGHARSILAARHLFTQPFLLHTADHIFDSPMIQQMRNFDLGLSAACVLVEKRTTHLRGLPATTVKVSLQDEYVGRINRKLSKFDGIDAGLFVCSIRIFDALETLAVTRPYFSLADALDTFCLSKELKWVDTANQTWFSIETEEQLAYVKDHTGEMILSPWTVFVAHAPKKPSMLSTSAPQAKSIFLGVSSSDHDSSLQVLASDRIKKSNVFNGFVVGVGNLESSVDVFQRKYDHPVGDVEAKPLLPLKESEHEDPYFLSIPVPETPLVLEDETHEAFLIEKPGADRAGDDHEFVLAVPERDVTERNLSVIDRKLTLPTDITDITLETVIEKEELGVQMVVSRRVPLIGFFLLGCALFSLSSVGAAMDLQVGVQPMVKLFWRVSATALAFLPLAMRSIWRLGGPIITKDLIQTMILCGISYTVFGGCFIIALELTSVGHAYIFNNSHSLIIVFGKFLVRSPVALLEGSGAIIGLVGGAICTLDHSKAEGTVGPSVSGDLVGLLGAVGGVGYLILAKRLRPKMDLFVFMSGLTLISTLCVFLYLNISGIYFEYGINETHGIFGWINLSSRRLPIELYLVFVCNFIGTMGYISVMKYFDPIVVSVVMLLEPIVASIIGVVIGVDGIPGLWTFMGGICVIIGTSMVTISSQQKTESIDVTEAVRSTTHNGTPLTSTRKLKKGF